MSLATVSQYFESIRHLLNFLVAFCAAAAQKKLNAFCKGVSTMRKSRRPLVSLLSMYVDTMLVASSQPEALELLAEELL